MPSSRDFYFGPDKFTIEFWIYPTSYVGAGVTTFGAQIFGTVYGFKYGYSINLGIDIDSFSIMSNAVPGATWTNTLTVNTGGGPALNTWTHMAVVRDGNNLTIYKNGVAVGTTSNAANWTFTGTTAVIGKYYDGTDTRNFSGFLDNLQVTRDRAKYTSNFIPPLYAITQA